MNSIDDDDSELGMKEARYDSKRGKYGRYVWMQTCTTCQAKFETVRYDAQYCSSKCRQAAYRTRLLQKTSDVSVTDDTETADRKAGVTEGAPCTPSVTDEVLEANGRKIAEFARLFGGAM
jgi:hypothetical protein